MQLHKSIVYKPRAMGSSFDHIAGLLNGKKRQAIRFSLDEVKLACGLRREIYNPHYFGKITFIEKRKALPMPTTY